MGVPQDLCLNMAERGHAFFNINIAITKSIFGFRCYLVKELVQILRAFDLYDTFATPTMDRT